MRFVFVDRVMALEPGRSITVVKNVAATEDVFADHFPGCPIFPGALVIETCEQASQLLVGASSDFSRVGRLARVARASFRRFVRPGDRLRARCVVRTGGDEAWTIAATVDVDGETAATAMLELALGDAEASAAARSKAGRVREMLRVLREGPLEAAGFAVTG